MIRNLTRRNTYLKNVKVQKSILSKTRKIKNNCKINHVTKLNYNIPERIQTQIDKNKELIIQEYKNKILVNPLPKLTNKKTEHYSEGFIRRMSQPLF